MMFTRALALTSMVSLSVLAAAMPGGSPPPPTTTISVKPGPTSMPKSKCSVGNLQCCNETQKATNPATSVLLALIGVVVQGVDALVGLDCNPISVVNVGGSNQCNAQTVCCPDNNVELSCLQGIVWYPSMEIMMVLASRTTIVIQCAMSTYSDSRMKPAQSLKFSPTTGPGPDRCAPGKRSITVKYHIFAQLCPEVTPHQHTMRYCYISHTYATNDHDRAR
ncbi:hydrophobin-domain-containing protein [Lentinus tigrinus ALCF2SS1-7]|uniref:Hydrophobin n=1 Tax=Lentinus tigrinus ALCF2SS1-6 TaxID=1328759 RepID=A0A5C2SQ95_9APHY|nr:hydrophobin-domain-containing protein [Lentinus tigrinus ALCF2SS1-6]RPD79077.1 hydrophobin-domain-containing protein [Lentinus tigrinus ALCF2SS1-7]